MTRSQLVAGRTLWHCHAGAALHPSLRGQSSGTLAIAGPWGPWEGMQAQTVRKGRVPGHLGIGEATTAPQTASPGVPAF